MLKSKVFSKENTSWSQKSKVKWAKDGIAALLFSLGWPVVGEMGALLSLTTYRDGRISNLLRSKAYALTS